MHSRSLMNVTGKRLALETARRKTIPPAAVALIYDYRRKYYASTQNRWNLNRGFSAEDGFAGPILPAAGAPCPGAALAASAFGRPYSVQMRLRRQTPFLFVPFLSAPATVQAIEFPRSRLFQPCYYSASCCPDAPEGCGD